MNYYPVVNSSGSGSFVKNHNKNASQKPLLLPVKSAYLELKKMGSPISAIIIDVEGFEFEILNSIIPLIKTNKPLLFIEMDNDKTKKDYLKSNFLKKTDYLAFIPTFLFERNSYRFNFSNFYTSNRIKLLPLTSLNQIKKFNNVILIPKKTYNFLKNSSI